MEMIADIKLTKEVNFMEKVNLNEDFISSDERVDEDIIKEMPLSKVEKVITAISFVFFMVIISIVVINLINIGGA